MSIPWKANKGLCCGGQEHSAGLQFLSVRIDAEKYLLWPTQYTLCGHSMKFILWG